MLLIGSIHSFLIGIQDLHWCDFLCLAPPWGLKSSSAKPGRGYRRLIKGHTTLMSHFRLSLVFVNNILIKRPNYKLLRVRTVWTDNGRAKLVVLQGP
jgi:hypothetical protein